MLLLTDPRGVVPLTAETRDIADDVLRRPVDRRELAARVRALLRTRAMSLRLRRTAELYRRERHIAERLQAAALPRSFPKVAGFRFDAFYRAASQEALVGGDWYDVVRLSDGRSVITVGDVSGAGLEAAVTMAAVRQALRGVSQIHPDPAMMLDAADRALQTEEPDRIVTAFAGVIDPVTGELTYATAGHPPPFLRDARGTVTPLRAFGVPMGVTARGGRTPRVVQLPPDATLVLYTDGLTEAARDPLTGEAILSETLADDALFAAQSPAKAVHDAVIGSLLGTGAADDDVAIVTVARCFDESESCIRRWSFDSNIAEEARATRRAFSEALEARGLDDGALRAAEIVFAELVGNVVRYAPGPAHIALDLDPPAPVLHVLDEGRGFRHAPRLPSDLLSERGRGLYIVSQLTEEFSATARRTGGSHARAVLSVAGDPLRVADALSSLADLDTLPV